MAVDQKQAAARMFAAIREWTSETVPKAEIGGIVDLGMGLHICVELAKNGEAVEGVRDMGVLLLNCLHAAYQMGKAAGKKEPPHA